MKKKKNGKLARSARESFAMVEDLFCDGPFIELRGRHELAVQGCRKILTCTENEVCLALRETGLHVAGKRLHCTTYYAGAVSVNGEIDALFFDDDISGKKNGGAS